MEGPASESLGEGSAATSRPGYDPDILSPTPTFCPAALTVKQRRTEATTKTIPPTPPNNTTPYHPAMAEEKQPPGLVEGATGEVEDEVQDKAKSAEDRKAAAALSKLDARDDDVAGASVDQEGLNKAMNKLSVSKATENKDLKKVKVDAADVALLVSLALDEARLGDNRLTQLSAQVDELDLTKPKATELLKQHEGDAVKAMRAFIAVK